MEHPLENKDYLILIAYIFERLIVCLNLLPKKLIYCIYYFLI